jgi:hypothetical protein
MGSHRHRESNLYCRVKHPVARTIKVVKIKPSLATTVLDIYYVIIIIATCFGLSNGHPQAILTILNIKIKVTIPTKQKNKLHGLSPRANYTY